MIDREMSGKVDRKAKRVAQIWELREPRKKPSDLALCIREPCILISKHQNREKWTLIQSHPYPYLMTSVTGPILSFVSLIWYDHFNLVVPIYSDNFDKSSSK